MQHKRNFIFALHANSLILFYQMTQIQLSLNGGFHTGNSKDAGRYQFHGNLMFITACTRALYWIIFCPHLILQGRSKPYNCFFVYVFQKIVILNCCIKSFHSFYTCYVHSPSLLSAVSYDKKRNNFNFEGICLFVKVQPVDGGRTIVNVF